MQIKNILKEARDRLGQAESSYLDAQLLLAHILKQSREYLLTWPEHEISAENEKQYFGLIEARQAGQPVAYLTGSRQFWNFSLNLSPAVLIPRPETELLIELALALLPAEKMVLADLGTGSGAIALALAKERPQWKVIASDHSPKALQVARENARSLQVSNLDFRLGNWCEIFSEREKLDAIIANPPYIDEADPHLQQGDVQFEPRSALVSSKSGFADLQVIASQAQYYLRPQGLLLLEHGFEQAAHLRQMLEKYGYNEIQTNKDLAGHDRVTLARMR